MRNLVPLVLLLLAHPAFADGKTTYTQICSPCHGDAGKGDGPAAIALDPKPAVFADPAFWAQRTDEQVEKAIREGGPAVGKSPLMAPLGAGFSPEQMKELIAYLKTLQAG